MKFDALVINDRYEVYRASPSRNNPDMDDYHIVHMKDGKLDRVERHVHVRSPAIEEVMRERYGDKRLNQKVA